MSEKTKRERHMRLVEFSPEIDKLISLELERLSNVAGRPITFATVVRHSMVRNINISEELRDAIMRTHL